MNIFRKIFDFMDKNGVLNKIDGLFHSEKDQLYIPIDKEVYEKYKAYSETKYVCCGLHDINGKKILLHHFAPKSKRINDTMMKEADYIVSCHSRFLPKKYRKKALFTTWGTQTTTVVAIPDSDKYALYVAPRQIYNINFGNKKTTVNQQ